MIAGEFFFACFIFLFFQTTAPAERWELWWFPAMLSAFMVLGMYAVVELSVKFVVSGDSLSWCGLFGTKRSISRTEVASIEESPLLQTVKVLDRHGDKLLSFGSLLIGYRELIELLESWAGLASAEEDFGNTYYVDKWIHLMTYIPPVGSLGLAVLLYFNGQGLGYVAFFIVVGLLSFWLPLTHRREVTVLPEKLIIKRLLGSREVPLETVERVEGGYQSSEYDAKTHVIKLKRRGRFNIELRGFRGQRALFEQIHEAWSGVHEDELGQDQS